MPNTSITATDIIEQVEIFAVETSGDIPENIRELDTIAYTPVSAQFNIINPTTFEVQGNITASDLPFAGFNQGLALGQEVPEGVNGLNWLNYGNLSGNIGVVPEIVDTTISQLIGIGSDNLDKTYFEDQVTLFDELATYNPVLDTSYSEFYYINAESGEISEQPIYWNSVVGVSSSEKLYYDKYADTLFKAEEWEQHWSYLHTTFYKTQIKQYNKKTSENTVTGEAYAEPKYVNDVTGDSSEYPIYYNTISKKSYAFPVYQETGSEKEFVDFAFIQPQVLKELRIQKPELNITINDLDTNAFFNKDSFRFWNTLVEAVRQIEQETTKTLWEIAAEIKSSDNKTLDDETENLYEIYQQFKESEEAVKTFKTWDVVLEKSTLKDPKNARQFRMDIKSNDRLYFGDTSFTKEQIQLLDAVGDINPTEDQLLNALNFISFRDNIGSVWNVDVIPFNNWMISVPRYADFSRAGASVEILRPGQLPTSAGNDFRNYYYIQTPIDFHQIYVYEVLNEARNFLCREFRFTEELDIDLIKLLRIRRNQGALPQPKSKGLLKRYERR